LRLLRRNEKSPGGRKRKGLLSFAKKWGGGDFPSRLGGGGGGGRTTLLVEAKKSLREKGIVVLTNIPGNYSSNGEGLPSPALQGRRSFFSPDKGRSLFGAEGEEGGPKLFKKERKRKEKTFWGGGGEKKQRE